MRLKTLPAEYRPREKLLAYGPQTLSDSELLAIFLNTGAKDKSVLDLAQELMDRHSSFAGILHATSEELKITRGVGQAKAVTLHAILELCRRYLSEQAREEPIANSSAAIKKYLNLRLKNKQRETFVCLCLNPQLRIVHYEELFYGTLTQVPVYPREVVKLALQHNAHALVLAHNHPSGTSNPSQADIAITQQIKDALATIDVLLLDHIIIAPNTTYAFSEHGLF